MKKPALKKFPNGLRTLLVPMEGQRTATALVLVACGSKYERKDENGISHFLEHMCFKGTSRRPNQLLIAGELEGMGAEYNAFTGHEYTGYYAKVAAPELPRALDILADVYADSLFRAEDIEKEKGAIVGEINMYEDIPMRKVNDLFMKLLYGDQPAGWSIAGPKDLVTTFTRERFLDYRARHYVPNATTVVIAGAFDARKTLALVKQKFGALKKGKKDGKAKVFDRQDAPNVLVEKKDSDQTHLVLGARGVPLAHRDYHTLQVLAGVLGGGMGSRLFQKVRTEMGLGYYVRAANDAFTDHGFFAASAGVVNERLPEAVTAIVAEMRRLKEELVTKEEITRVKEMLRGRLLLGLESSDDIAEFYGFQEVLRRKLLTPDDVMRQIERVTPASIRRAARTYFVPEQLNLAVVGPWEDAAALKAILAGI